MFSKKSNTNPVAKAAQPGTNSKIAANRRQRPDIVQPSSITPRKAKGEQLNRKGNKAATQEVAEPEPPVKIVSSEKKKAKLFFSYYSQRSIEGLTALADFLKTENCIVWLDQPGRNPISAIDDCDIFVLFLSGEYLKDAKCRQEAEYAKQTQKPILPFRVYPEFRLSGWLSAIISESDDFIDFTKPFETLSLEAISRVAEIMAESISSYFKKSVLKHGNIVGHSGYAPRLANEDDLQMTLKKLTSSSRGSVMLVIGDGGVGKSATVTEGLVMRDNVLWDCGIRQVYWLNVYSLSGEANSGKYYEQLCQLMDIAYIPGDRRTEYRLRHKLRTMTADTKILLVLEDVVNPTILHWTSALGRNIHVVAITSLPDAMEWKSEIGATVEKIERSDSTVRSLLTYVTSKHADFDKDRLVDMSKLCHGLPLISSIASARLFNCPDSATDFDEVYSDISEKLQGLDASEPLSNEKDKVSLSKFIHIAFGEKDGGIFDNYLYFLLFEKNEMIDIADISVMWKCENDDDALEWSSTFNSRSLVRSCYLAKEKKECLAIHPCLFDSAVAYVTEHGSLHRLQIEMLKRIRNEETGENILHQIIRRRRRHMLETALKILYFSNDSISELAQLSTTQTTDELETPLHVLYRAEWSESIWSEDSQLEENYSIKVFCEWINELLTFDREKAIEVLQIEDSNGTDILDLLLASSDRDKSKPDDNAFLVAVRNHFIPLQKFLIDEVRINRNVQDNQGFNALMTAVEASNLVDGSVLLRDLNKLNINAKNKLGQTALILAAKANCSDRIAKLFQRHDCDCNALDNNGESALIWAASHKDSFNVVQLLIHHDADVTVRGVTGSTALWKAVSAENRRTTALLWQVGARFSEDEIEFLFGGKVPPDDWFDEGKPFRSPEKMFDIYLKRAQSKRQKSINPVVSLVLFGDVRSSNQYGFWLHTVLRGQPKDIENILKKQGSAIPLYIKQQALVIATRCQHLEVVRIILEQGVDVDTRDKEGSTPLMTAISYGKDPLIKLLLQSGANVNLVNNDGETPLMLALQYGLEKLAIAIVKEYKAEVNAFDERGATALCYAAKRGLDKACKNLISNDADVDVVTARGVTPLFYAVWGGNVDVVQSLIDNDVNVNFREMRAPGQTPLMAAAMQGNAGTVQLLLNNKAVVDETDHLGKTALLYSLESGDLETVETLINSGASLEVMDASGNGAVKMAAISGNEEIIKILVDKKVDAEVRDKAMNTPLMLAAKGGHVGAMKLFIDNGGDVNDRNKFDRTAMFYAAERGSVEAMQCLMKEDAAFDLADNTGVTPLILAAMGGHEEAVKFLFEKEVNVDNRDKNGMTALMAAAMNGHETVTKLIRYQNPDPTSILVTPI